MNKVFYSIISYLPLFGLLYKQKTKLMFCSMGLYDGAYDYALKLIEEYQHTHPYEQITVQLMEKLIEESNNYK